MNELMNPESSRRDGIAAFPIILADGQPWGFALASSRFKPEVVPGVDDLGRPVEIVRVVTEVGYPLAIRRQIDELRCSCESGEAQGQYEALIRLAMSLLRRAHDLEPRVAASLLEVGAEDLPDFVNALLSVVTGDCLETLGSPR